MYLGPDSAICQLDYAPSAHDANDGGFVSFTFEYNAAFWLGIIITVLTAGSVVGQPSVWVSAMGCT